MIPEEEVKEETFKLDPGKTSDRQIDDDQEGVKGNYIETVNEIRKACATKQNMEI